MSINVYFKRVVNLKNLFFFKIYKWSCENSIELLQLNVNGKSEMFWSYKWI